MMSTYVTAVSLSILTAFKMLLVLSICLLGVFHAGIMSRGTDQLDSSKSFNDIETAPGDWVLALVNCLYAYNGWNMLNSAASEVVDPSTTIPLAINTGLIVAIVSFLWINVS
jgi:APA family basic amino acid/polyamine antiporter